MLIRKAIYDDLEAITEIYNEAIANTNATFDMELKDQEERRRWLDEHSEKYPVLVFEQDKEVLGYASLSRWSDRCAYDNTAEISIYFYPQARGKGYGNLLMKAILEKGRQGGLHTILSRITEGNDSSIHLHLKYGFHMIGPMREVGVKFGKLLDVYMMQFIYSNT